MSVGSKDFVYEVVHDWGIRMCKDGGRSWGGGRSSDNSIIFNFLSSKNWEHCVERQIKSPDLPILLFTRMKTGELICKSWRKKRSASGWKFWFVELNPVRAGIVKKAWVYPWSSTSFPTGRSKIGPASERSAIGRLGEKKWAEFLTGATRAKDQAIRQMTRTGRPAGKAAFVDLVERLTDRDLSKDKPGRPVTKDK